MKLSSYSIGNQDHAVIGFIVTAGGAKAGALMAKLVAYQIR